MGAPLRKRSGSRSRLRRKDFLIACLITVVVALGVVSAQEYFTIQSAGPGIALASNKGIEVVYNLQGVAIAVSCCPNLVSSFVVGQYLFQDSSVSPPPPLTINGTTTNFQSGVALVMTVSPLSDQGKTQQIEFVWPGGFNETTPTPANASLFGGSVIFHWYTLLNILYMHVET